MIRSFHLTEGGDVRTELSPDDIRGALASRGTLWVDFFRPSREESSMLADVFGFHPLAIDDCLHPNFRPKVHAFEEYLFLVLHGPDLDSRDEINVQRNRPASLRNPHHHGKAHQPSNNAGLSH